MCVLLNSSLKDSHRRHHPILLMGNYPSSQI